MLVELYRQGRFPLDAFVTERIGLGDIESAFTKMQRGDVLRSVVELDRPSGGQARSVDSAGGFAPVRHRDA